jgi:beta-N-acetylhexosaminidase
VIGDIVRGRIGFDNLLMSDDLGMHALKGSFTDRAAGVIAAGCDLALHCSGDMAEMQACAAGVGEIAPRARARLLAAMATIAGDPDGASFAALTAKRDALLALRDAS